MKIIYRRITLVSILFLALASLLSGRAQSEGYIPGDTIANDPEVRAGVLENGLHYYVRSNKKPAGRAELRLIIRAGSVLEDDDQRGLAHFLEHMLFNGTEKYPANELIDVLESFGMEFGPDINAYTSFDQTVYQLSVSSDDETQFSQGLDVLEEWAFKASLTEEEFEKERGVVLEEWRGGRGADARMMDEEFPVLFSGSRYADRLPIGDVDIIQYAPVEALRRFYRDWYRPDLMAVIAVGDFNPDETVEMIRERFEGHSNPKYPRNRTEFAIPGHEETLVKVVTDPEATQASAQIYTKYEPKKSVYRSDIKRDLAEQLFFVMFNQRMSEIARREDAPFLYGYGFTTSYTDKTSLSGLGAGVAEDKVLSGMEALISEAERVQTYGFLDSELNRAKQDVMSFFENYWKQRNDLESTTFVQPLIDAFLKDESYPSIDWQWETVQELLPGITMDEVTGVSDQLLSDSNRVILVDGPSVPAVDSVTEEQILDVLSRVESSPVTQWEDSEVSGPLVADPPQPGRIVSQESIPGTGVERWVLSNGAVVLLKPTDFKSDEILFQAYSRGGYSRVDDVDYISAQFAVDAVIQGGLGDFSADHLRKALAGKNVSLSPYMQETYEGFTGGSTPAADLETMLQLLYLNQTATRRDEAAWNSLMVRSGEALKNRDSSPMVLYSDLLWETLYDDHFRSRPLTMEKLEGADLDKALEIFAQRFSNASDFTYIFVGDIDTGELKPLVEQWIGGMPSEADGEEWIDRGMRNVVGVKDVSLEAGTEPLSVVTQVWTGDWDGSFTERYRLQSLASALQMQFTRSIREDSGGSYSVGVYPQLSVAPVNDYRFIIRFSCAPDRVEELTGQIRGIIDEWRTAPPETRYADDVTASQQRSLSVNLERNSWWIGQISFALSTEINPEEMLDRRALYDTLTPEILRDTANRYLDDNNYVQVVLYPEGSE